MSSIPSQLMATDNLAVRVSKCLSKHADPELTDWVAVSNPRGYNNAGQQHSNSGPQQAHQYGGHPQQRTSSNSGYNKNYAAQNQHQQGQANQPPVPAPLTRGTEGSEEAK